MLSLSKHEPIYYHLCPFDKLRVTTWGNLKPFFSNLPVKNNIIMALAGDKTLF